MTLPQVQGARPYYQAAFQGFEDAQILSRAGRTTGAMYLAGYGVECMLEAMVLSIVPPGERGDILDSFRGTRAQNFDWLRETYFGRGGRLFPSPIAKHFSPIDIWSTDLRYKAGTARPDDAGDFSRAAGEIMDWADGRL